jgi:RNA polymerase sigma-70 factor (ECF subfamily)
MDMDTDLIWREFYQRLRLFIARRVRDEADAEDILQEVFLRIHDRMATLQDGGRLVAWIYQITRNAIVDYYRAPARRREIAAGGSTDMEEGGVLATATAPEPEPDADQPGREMAACLRPMIAQLPDPYREAVVQVELEGRTHREVAADLGLSLSGMKSRVQRGRHQLGTMLRDCCHIQLGIGGGIVDYRGKDESCYSCASCAEERS